MISTGFKAKNSSLTSPHVREITSTRDSTWFALQLCLQFSRQLGNCSESERVTLPPTFAATIPGKAVPAPIYK